MPARANLFQVVTFAADPLQGNPAFVLSGAGAASDKALAQACAMLRTDVIAVVGEAKNGDAPLKFFRGGGIAQIHIGQRKAAIQKMNMGIVEAGKNLSPGPSPSMETGICFPPPSMREGQGGGSLFFADEPRCVFLMRAQAVLRLDRVTAAL